MPQRWVFLAKQSRPLRVSALVLVIITATASQRPALGAPDGEMLQQAREIDLPDIGEPADLVFPVEPPEPDASPSRTADTKAPTASAPSRQSSPVPSTAGRRLTVRTARAIPTPPPRPPLEAALPSTVQMQPENDVAFVPGPAQNLAEDGRADLFGIPLPRFIPTPRRVLRAATSVGERLIGVAGGLF
jgi:hypothetical protein